VQFGHPASFRDFNAKDLLKPSLDGGRDGFTCGKAKVK
jgi:hypothetical protein